MKCTGVNRNDIPAREITLNNSTVHEIIKIYYYSFIYIIYCTFRNFFEIISIIELFIAFACLDINLSKLSKKCFSEQ